MWLETDAAPRRRRFRAAGLRLFYALCCAVSLSATAPGAEPPAPVMLLDRLCAQTLRPNEEERLFGMISIAVRATIKYEHAVFSPDLIDDAIDDALGATLDACPMLAATDGPRRLGMVVELIRQATVARLHDKTARYSIRQTDEATAADLSEELSSREIDAWLDALPPRRRALALLLYASDVKPAGAAAALGLPPPALRAGFGSVKADLLQFFREDWNSPPPPPIPPRPAMEFRPADQPLAALLVGNPAANAAVRVTGISGDIYAGWSLLAVVSGLPAGRELDLAAPLLLVPVTPGRKRMLVTAIDEIGDPHDSPRRFLLKAFAIDGDGEGAGLNDAFRLGAVAIDNAEASQTLANRNLTAIETARCLAHDYGTAGDPGLCR